jgi:hypothetical protein
MIVIATRILSIGRCNAAGSGGNDDRGHHGCNRLATTFVRGFLDGVVRKKLGINLVSEPGENGRVYRIIDDMASPAKTDRVKQAA